MEWFSKQLETAGVGGPALQGAAFLDKRAAAAIAAASAAVGAVERLAVTAALVPPVAGIHLSQLRLQGVERVAAELLKASVDTVFAAFRVGSMPYGFAAQVIAALGGDALKLGRGTVAAGLATVNLVPFLLNRLARLGGQTPEQIATAFTTAPVAVALSSCLQAAHDALEPLAKPLPKAIKARLRGHFDAGLLDRARFLVSSFGLTVPEAMQGLRLALPGEPDEHRAAFAVLNLIVFADHPGSVQLSTPRWAYALAHLEIYEELGVDGWSEHYVRDLAGLEARARSRAEEVAAALG